MPAIVSSNFRSLNAQAFIEDVTGDKSNVYIGLGKSSPWASLLTNTVDDTPPTPIDTLDAINEARQQLIGLKLVSPADVAHVVPRYDWVSGATFVPWDSTDSAIYDKAFYALTADFKVYKCIVAGSSYVSDVPTHTDEVIKEMLDGYYWKYMYTILASDSEKFLTNSYMPVKTLTEETKATAATVSGSAFITLSEENNFISVGQKVTAATSSAITDFNTTVVSVSGKLVELSANANATVAASNLTFGAYAASNPLFAQQESQRTSRAIGSNQGIERLKLVSGGSGYPTDGSGITIAVTGDGTGFQINSGNSGVVATYINNSGAFTSDIVVDIGGNITNPGTNYSIAQAVVSGGSPTATAAFTPIIAPRGRSGFTTVVASSGGGHGCDPVVELGGFYVAINVQISGTADSQISNTQDFRQISLIKNPTVSNLLPSTPASALNALKFITYASGYNSTGSSLGVAAQIDDYVIEQAAGFKAFVVNVDTDNNKIYYFQNDLTGYVAPSATADSTFSTAGVAAPAYNLTAANTSAANGTAEFDAGSGEILFLENRDPIQRSTSQIEDVKLIIEF